MLRVLFYTSIILVLPAMYVADGPTSGVVEIDEHSFDKIVNKFEAVLVKFDAYYPYGDKHEAFVALGKDAKLTDDLLIASVSVKDYGAKDNEDFAKRFGVDKENFPAVKLFLKGRDEPITFEDKNGFTTQNLRKFVRQNSNVYLNLPGCVKELDLLAAKFMKTEKDKRKDVYQKVLTFLDKTVSKEKQTTGKIYKVIFERILEKGDVFVENEVARLNKLLSDKVSDEKKKDLNKRLNILENFKIEETKEKAESNQSDKGEL